MIELCHKAQRRLDPFVWGLCVCMGLSSTAAGAEPVAAEQGGDSAETGLSPRVQVPALLSAPPLPYPEGRREDVVVALKLLVGADGAVGDVEVVDGKEPFASIARDFAWSLRFSPALVEGEPRAAWIGFRVEFEAPEPELSAQPEPTARQQVTAPHLASSASSPSESSPVEIEVVGERKSGVTRLISDEETRILPGAEGDPLRALDAFPGTVPVLASGPFIGLRGAEPGKVGYDYDGIDVPYLFHLGRGKAVVSPWLVDSAALYGTGGPPSLGRAGAGTIRATAAPAEGRFRAHARVLTSDSELGLEVPFADGRGSFLAAGRYSYTQLLVSLIAPEFTLNYWDYQARIRYRLDEENSVELLTFGAGDHSGQEQEDGTQQDLFKGSFHRVALRYSHNPERGTQYRVGLVFGHDRWDAQPSLIRPHGYSLTARLELSEPERGGVTFRYGADTSVWLQTDYRYLDPTQVSVEKYERTDWDWGAFAGWEVRASAKTTFELGARLDFFLSSETPFDPSATDIALSPRFGVSHQATSWLRLHNSLGMTSQRPSTAQRPPGRQFSVSGGAERSILADAGAEFVLPFDTRVDATVFQSVFLNASGVDDLKYVLGQVPDERGVGRATGLEVLLRRTFAKRFVGFASYTLSRSYRSVGRVTAPAQFDRRHVFDVAMAYFFDKGWTVSSRATYYTGFPARMASVRAFSDQPRAKPYFQLDWQVEKRWRWGDYRSLALTMGVLNTTLSSDANDMFCVGGRCEESLVGPATIPTVGVEGNL